MSWTALLSSSALRCAVFIFFALRATASFSWSDKGRFGQRMTAGAATAAGEAEGGGTVEPGNRDSGADGAAEAGGAAGEADDDSAAQSG